MRLLLPPGWRALSPNCAVLETDFGTARISRKGETWHADTQRLFHPFSYTSSYVMALAAQFVLLPKEVLA